MNCQEYTIAQWLQTWYDLYAKQNIRESPRLQYSYFINHLVIPQIGEIPLSQLTGLRLQILYQDLRTNGRVRSQKRMGPGLSPKTVRSVHMLLHAALEQAVRAGIIAKNPTMECKPPKLEQKEIICAADRELSAGGSRAKRAADVLPGTNHRPAPRRAAGPALERSGPTEQKHLCDEI